MGRKPKKVSLWSAHQAAPADMLFVPSSVATGEISPRSGSEPNIERLILMLCEIPAEATSWPETSQQGKVRNRCQRMRKADGGRADDLADT